MLHSSVLFFGDSITAGVGDETGLGWVGRVVDVARASGVAVDPHNFGVPGDTSSQVAARWERQARGVLGGVAPSPVGGPGAADVSDCEAALAPARVVFSFGANDTLLDGGALRVPTEKTLANLAAVLTRAAELGFSCFVVGPTPVDDPATRQRAIALSQQMAQVAARHAAGFVDIAATIDASALWRGEVMSGDGAHPASGGYALLADLIAAPLITWLTDRPAS